MILNLLKILPKNYMSYAFGKIAEIQWPKPMTTAIIRWFAQTYKINLNEVEKSLESYSSLSDFFVRKLKPEVRPIEDGIVHPCDSTITEFGLIENGTLIQAKGITYKLIDLLNSSALSQELNGGFYITYYLCPADYHRVHAPSDLMIHSCTHVPGQLWPVNSWSVCNIENLFPRNERLILNLEIENQPAALVMVGATNVGKMTVSFDKKIVTNNFSKKITDYPYRPPVLMKKGEHLGTFHMGSTVVMIYSRKFVSRFSNLKRGPVQMGRQLI